MAELSGVNFTTDDLISEIKVRQTIPTAPGLFTDDDFVRLLDGAMRDKVIPAIHKVKENYFVTYSDTALVANQDAYTIPSRAVGAQLRHWCYVDADGTESELPRLDIEDSSKSAALYGALFKGHQVILKPTPASAVGSIRFYFERRPNKLCKTSNAAKVSSLNTGTKQVTFVSRPSSWAIGTKLDFICGDPIFHSRGDGYPITSISGNTATFSAGLPTGLAVDDYAAQAGLSPIPQLPVEAFNVISQFAAAASMRSLSNKRPMQDAEMEGDKMLAAFIDTINPRVDGETKRFSNPGGGIFGASGSGTGWRLNVGP